MFFFCAIYDIYDIYCVIYRQKTVAAHLESKQLPLFVFTRRSVCQYSMAEEIPATQRQTAVTAQLKSKQLLLFVFELPRDGGQSYPANSRFWRNVGLLLGKRRKR